MGIMLPLFSLAISDFIVANVIFKPQINKRLHEWSALKSLDKELLNKRGTNILNKHHPEKGEPIEQKHGWILWKK